MFAGDDLAQGCDLLQLGQADALFAGALDQCKDVGGIGEQVRGIQFGKPGKLVVNGFADIEPEHPSSAEGWSPGDRLFRRIRDSVLVLQNLDGGDGGGKTAAVPQMQAHIERAKEHPRHLRALESHGRARGSRRVNIERLAVSLGQRRADDRFPLVLQVTSAKKRHVAQVFRRQGARLDAAQHGQAISVERAGLGGVCEQQFHLAHLQGDQRFRRGPLAQFELLQQRQHHRVGAAGDGRPADSRNRRTGNRNSPRGRTCGEAGKVTVHRSIMVGGGNGAQCARAGRLRTFAGWDKKEP